MPTETKSSNRTAVRLLTIRETADSLGVSVETIRRRIKYGELHIIRDGRVIRIHPDDLEMFIAVRRIRKAGSDRL
jgi:excisionase family DNA binding protein